MQRLERVQHSSAFEDYTYPFYFSIFSFSSASDHVVSFPRANSIRQFNQALLSQGYGNLGSPDIPWPPLAFGIRFGARTLFYMTGTSSNLCLAMRWRISRLEPGCESMVGCKKYQAIESCSEILCNNLGLDDWSDACVGVRKLKSQNIRSPSQSSVRSSLSISFLTIGRESCWNGA